MPRTIRAVTIHWNAASSSTKISQVWPRNVGERIAMIRNAGRTSSRSMTASSTAFSTPPK